jgi:hypothetical protein
MIPLYPDNGLRTASLISLALIIIAGIWVLLTSKQSMTDSISERLVHNRAQYIVMASLLTVCGAIFYLFGYLWIGPTYHVPLLFYLILIISYVAQVTVAWTSVSGKSKIQTSLHIRGGETVALSMAFCLFLLFTSSYSSLPFFSYWVSLVILIFSIYCIGWYTFSSSLHKKFAVYESAYIAFFVATVVCLIAKV